MTPVPQPPPCLVCARPMQTRVVEGFSASVCQDHGIWLDKNELQKIIESIKVEEMRKAQEQIQGGNLGAIAEATMKEGVIGRWWNRF